MSFFTFVDSRYDRFNAGLDSKEKTIVTSTGPYIGEHRANLGCRKRALTLIRQSHFPGTQSRLEFPPSATRQHRLHLASVFGQHCRGPIPIRRRPRNHRHVARRRVCRRQETVGQTDARFDCYCRQILVRRLIDSRASIVLSF